MIRASQNPFSCEPVVFSASNIIVSLGTISRIGNVFTFSVGFVWRINGTIYQNTAPIVLTIAEATDGFNRIDNAILKTSNSIELQQGLESDSVVLQPIVPETNILLTSWNINGDSVDDQTTPILGTNFLKKEYEKAQVVNISGASVIIPLNIFGRNHIILNGSVTGIAGFSLENLDANPTIAEYPHEGKDYYIQNNTGHDVTLDYFNNSADISFLSKDGNDIVIPNNGIISFKNSFYVLQEVFRSWIDNKSTFTIELLETQSVDFYAPAVLRMIDSDVIVGTAFAIIEVNDAPYTFGNLIGTGSKITVTADGQLVINLYVRYE